MTSARSSRVLRLELGPVGELRSGAHVVARNGFVMMPPGAGKLGEQCLYLGHERRGRDRTESGYGVPRQAFRAELRA